MQRIAGLCVVVCALVLSAGCEDKNKDMETEPAQTASFGYEEPSSDYYAPQVTSADTSTDVYATTAQDDAYQPAGTTHTVGQGDTLYALARMYYSDEAKWRDIYTANSNVLSSPDTLAMGQQLVIP